MTDTLRIGFMAGRGIPAREIAAQLNLPLSSVQATLRRGNIRPAEDRGPTVHLVVPIAAFVPDLDAVGNRRRMSRDRIACEVLRSVFAGGAAAIEAQLDRTGMDQKRLRAIGACL